MPTHKTQATIPSAISDTTPTSHQRFKGTIRTGGSRAAWMVSWGTKGGLALADQALFAGAQFVLNIMLARWLPPAGYGAFAVAYSVFVLASGAHSALLLEPMIIFGSGKYFKNRKSYVELVLRGHWWLTVFAGGVVLGSGVLVGRLYSHPVGHALLALGLALPFMLFAWLTRRAFYIELQPGRAAVGSAVYFCTLITLVSGLHSARILTPATAIIVMGAAALLRGTLELVWLRLRWPQPVERVIARGLATEHWGYGRWALASAMAIWLPLNVYYLVLPAWFGLKAAGALKALMNLVNPAGHSMLALASLVLPALVRHRDIGGIHLVRHTVRRILGFFLAGATVYFVILWHFRVSLIHILYGGQYLEYSGLPVLLVGLTPVVTACIVSLGSALRACERPDRIFWSYLVGSAVALTLGIWLAAAWGLVGALAGYLVSYGALMSMLLLFYWKLDWAGTTV